MSTCSRKAHTSEASCASTRSTSGWTETSWSSSGCAVSPSDSRVAEPAEPGGRGPSPLSRLDPLALALVLTVVAVGIAAWQFSGSGSTKVQASPALAVPKPDSRTVREKPGPAASVAAGHTTPRRTGVDCCARAVLADRATGLECRPCPRRTNTSAGPDGQVRAERAALDSARRALEPRCLDRRPLDHRGAARCDRQRPLHGPRC